MWSQLTDGRNHGELIGPFVEIFSMAIGYPVCLVPLIGVNSKTMMKYAIKTTITQLIQKVAEYGSKLFPSYQSMSEKSTPHLLSMNRICINILHIHCLLLLS